VWIDLPRGAQLPVGSSHIVCWCRVPFKPAPQRHSQTWHTNSHPSRVPPTPGRFHRLPCHSSGRWLRMSFVQVPRPHPGLRSLSSDEPSPLIQVLLRLPVLRRARAESALAAGRGLSRGESDPPCAARLPGPSACSPDSDCPFPMHDESMCANTAALRMWPQM
jgi:hypothetical protein